MTTQMYKEASETPELVATQLQENQQLIKQICERLQQQPPAFAVTIGRGSSDHACTYAKYLLEIYHGLTTASAAPSVLTMYGSKLNTKNALVIGISQSGKSPDICDVMITSRRKGAITIAITNQLSSPLAKAAEYVIPILAGPEKAVAATKSYIMSLTALLQLNAHWSAAPKLLRALDNLPEKLNQALTMDWDPAIEYFQTTEDTLVLARGFGFPIAQEAALKFKETSVIHAEAFSGAEVMHGPFTLIRKDHPYLMFMQKDNSLEGMLRLATKIKALGGKPIIATTVDNQTINETAEMLLPLPKSLHSVCDPLLTIQAFYPFIAKLAVTRNYNPDQPHNLNKITETT